MGPGKSYSSSNKFKLSAHCLTKVPLDENKLEGNHLLVKTLLSTTPNNLPLEVHALIDCGASGFAFVDEEFAHQQNFPLSTLKTPQVVEVIDGRPISSGDITQIAKIPMTIGEHKEELPTFVTQLGHYPLVLGIPWLRCHDVSIRFASNTVTFDSPKCIN